MKSTSNDPQTRPWEKVQTPIYPRSMGNMFVFDGICVHLQSYTLLHIKSADRCIKSKIFRKNQKSKIVFQSNQKSKSNALIISDYLRSQYIWGGGGGDTHLGNLGYGI